MSYCCTSRTKLESFPSLSDDGPVSIHYLAVFESQGKPRVPRDESPDTGD